MPWFAKPKAKFSCEHLADLCQEVIKFAAAPERAPMEVVTEALREIAEIVVWGDRNDAKIFDLFLERNMLPFFIQIALSRAASSVKVQVIQTLSILLGNLRSPESVFYLLSGDYMNRLIEHPFDFEDDEVMSNYINFVKSLSLRFDKHTIQFFFNRDHHSFPLYEAALKFFSHPESLVRAGVRAIFVNICKVEDDYVRRYVLCTKRYQHHLCWSLRQQCQNIDSSATMLEEQVNYSLCPSAFPAPARQPLRLQAVDDMAQDLVDDMHYVQDLHSLDPQLHRAIECGLRGVLLDPFLCASIKGLPEGTAQISRHVAVYIAAQWAECAGEVQELYRVQLDALFGVPFVDEFDEEEPAGAARRAPVPRPAAPVPAASAAPAAASGAGAAGARHPQGLVGVLDGAWDDADPRVPAACVALLFSWAASPPSPELQRHAMLAPHRARGARRDGSGLAGAASPLQLAPVVPPAPAPAPAPPAPHAAAGAVAGEEDEDEEGEQPPAEEPAPQLAPLTGSFILRRPSDADGSESESAADGEVRPAVPPVPELPPRPSNAWRYDYPFDAVHALLVWLCRVIRDLPRRGRLESVLMCIRALIELADIPGEAVHLAPLHAALLRDAYRTCCCLLRRRLELFRRELLRRQEQHTRGRSSSAAPRSDGFPAAEGRDIGDPLELVFLLLSGEMPTHRQLTHRRARDLTADVTQLLPLLSPLAPPSEEAIAAASAASAAAHADPCVSNDSVLTPVQADEAGAADAPLLEPPQRAPSNGHPAGPSTPPLRASPHATMPSPAALSKGASPPANPSPPRSRPVTPRGRRSPSPAAPALPSAPAAEPEPPARGPGQYRVVGSAGAMVRSAESLESKYLARLKQGTTVQVDEVRQRRCYISAPVQGWVSMWNSQGGVILQPLVRAAVKAAAEKATANSPRKNGSAQWGPIPDWLRAVPLSRRLPTDADELAKVEAGVFLLVRDLVFRLTNRPNEIAEYLQVQDGGPLLRRIGGDIETTKLTEGFRCQVCQTPAPPPDARYCCTDFAELAGSVLYLFVEDDEVLLLKPVSNQLERARLVCCCYLYFTYAVVDARLGFRLTLRCKSFQCALTFENAPTCQQIAQRVNLLARQRREGKCALLAPVLMDSEIPVDPVPCTELTN
eukprot:TRINITY_DN11969_c0_g1_i1.p1 TRINITY_DN11969_c0_g1~~TRINITY_DN11969_c0_g1_i1.p1  ORF type:complete len:1139 (+),score=352.39 TRINITY_DN11969_c0_g1_i1:181-3597(+)